MKNYLTEFINRWGTRRAAPATAETVTETTVEKATETVTENPRTSRSRTIVIIGAALATLLLLFGALAFAPGLRETHVARAIRFWETAPAPAPAVPPGQLAAEMEQQQQATAQNGSAVTVDANMAAALGVQTATVEAHAVDQPVRTTGRVLPDERRITNVHTRIEGWIDQTFGNFEGQQITKGQPLFTIYSPELVATQQEYLIALRARGDFNKSEFEVVRQSGGTLVDATRRRLQLFDVTPQQIAEVERTGRVFKNVTFYAPASGVVTERKAFPGMRITADTQLYTLADLSTVWVVADVFESDLTSVHVGTAAEVTLPNKETRTGRVSYINPLIETQTRTAQARIEVPNPKMQLKPGMFVNISLRVVQPPQVLVPRDAVIATGTRNLVLVDDGKGNFNLREITTGGQLGDSYIVQSGIGSGDRVARNIQFLIDSETQLRQAIEGQSGTPSNPGGANGGGMQGMPGMPGMK